jgi:hypothetical protein
LVDKADIPRQGLGEPPQPHVTFLW